MCLAAQPARKVAAVGATMRMMAWRAPGSDPSRAWSSCTAFSRDTTTEATKAAVVGPYLRLDLQLGERAGHGHTTFGTRRRSHVVLPGGHVAADPVKPHLRWKAW